MSVCPLSLVRKFRQVLPESVFRILFSLIFVVAGAGHIFKPATIVSRLLQAPGADIVTRIAPPQLLVIATGVVLLSAGLALLFGLWVRYSALLLIGVLVPITLTAQVGTGEMGPLFKNIALFGGLIFFAFGQSLEIHKAGFETTTGSEKNGGWQLFHRGVATSVALAGIFGAGLFWGQSGATAVAGTPAAVSAGAAFLVREPAHIKAALSTAAEALEGTAEFKAKAASIVICGPTGVAVAMTGHMMEESLRKAREQGIDVSVCGLTLKEKGIDPSLVSKSVRIVENGMLEIMRLQQEGYLSVQL